MKYILLFVTLTPVLLYLNMMWIISTPRSNTFYLNRFSSLCSVIHSKYAVLRKITHTEFTSTYKDYAFDNCEQYEHNTGDTFELKYRPLIGDHLHIGYILSLNGERVILHDRNVTEPIPYETKSNLCLDPSTVAYEKTWLHSGIHTHCDEVIHIHPWSAYWPLEGRDVTLAQWFKSVNIEDYNHHHKGYKIGSEYYNLNMAFYANVQDEEPQLVTSDYQKINGLWLKNHHAMVVLYAGVRPEITAEDVERVIKMNKYPNNYP